MEVVINGEKRTIENVGTIEQLLAELSLPGNRRGIAVAVNDTVVPRSQWKTVRIAAGDRIEVIRAVQGG